MTRQFKSIILVLFLFSLSHLLLAQELVRSGKANRSEGITLEFDIEILTPSANFLAVGDTSNQMLVLSNFILDEQNIWLKKSDEEVVDSNNAVHWYYNEEAQLLFVNLTGVMETFSPGTNLQLTILPVNSSKKELSLSIFEALTDSGNLPEDLQKISDLNIDLK